MSTLVNTKCYNVKAFMQLMPGNCNHYQELVWGKGEIILLWTVPHWRSAWIFSSHTSEMVTNKTTHGNETDTKTNKIKIENRKIRPGIFNHVMFLKVIKNIFWRDVFWLPDITGEICWLDNRWTLDLYSKCTWKWIK